MFWNYPVAVWFYLAAGLVLAVGVLPRYFDAVIKSRLFWLVGAALFVAGMLLLPAKNYLLGDGLTHLANPARVFSATEPLEVFLHHVVYLVLGSSTVSYWSVAFVAGLFYLLGVYLISRLGETTLERSIIALAFICLGTVQFYLGYVEHYTLLNLFALYYLYFAWREMKRESVSLAPLLFFVLAFVSHLSAIVLLPSLFYLYWPRFKKWLFVIAVPIVAAGVVAAIAVNIRQIMVPLSANDFSTYSLLSGAHLVDLVRLLILVSPAFFLTFWKPRCNRTLIFTLLALAGALAFTILVDPKIGAFRDWDLLSVFAVPLAALVALQVPRYRLTAVILLILIVVRIVPWLEFNSKQQNEFVERVVLADPHYSEQYDKGQRLVSWGLLLYKLGDYRGAETAWKQKLQYTPNHENTLAMLAPLEYKMGNLPESYQAYLRLLGIDPNNAEYRYHVVYMMFRINDYNSAMSMMLSSPPEFVNNVNSQRLLAGIVGAMGDHERAVQILESAPGTDSDGYLPYMLAKSCLAAGRIDLARSLIGRAMELDPTNLTYQKLADNIPE